jgi:hypothetical protein
MFVPDFLAGPKPAATTRGGPAQVNLIEAAAERHAVMATCSPCARSGHGQIVWIPWDQLDPCPQCGHAPYLFRPKPVVADPRGRAGREEIARERAARGVVPQPVDVEEAVRIENRPQRRPRAHRLPAPCTRAGEASALATEGLP